MKKSYKAGKGGKKGKGKKSSKNKNKDWSFEGGLISDIIASNGEGGDVKPKGPRKTQEKDERMRRGRIKMDDNKKKRDFVRKMSRKITFSEVLKDELDTIEPAPKKIKVNTAEVKNETPAAVRLQQMLGHVDVTEIYNSESEDEEKDVETEPDNENAEEAREINQLKVECDIIDANIDTPEDDPVVEDDENDEIDDKKDDNYSLFLSNELIANTTSPLSKLRSFDNYNILGNIHSSFKLLPRITSLKQIQYLNKLWRSRLTDDAFNSNLFSASLLSELMPLYLTYANILCEGRNYQNDNNYLKPSLFHILAHVLRARSNVLKHNYKIKKKLDAKKIEDSMKKSKRKKGLAQSEVDIVSPAMQDQGYTRARVLILTPFRGTAMKCVNTIKEILGENTTISSSEKFNDEFGEVENEEQPVYKDKGEEWKSIFENQNIDDDFKLGIQCNPGQGKGGGHDKGVYLRLFSDFYQSDIIIASPLGLRILLENKEKEDSDFLSSIEIVCIHQADILYFQNWDHVDYILQHVNLLPSKDRGTDFSRIRPYFLDGKGAEHRQLLILSAFNQPAIQATFREFGRSLANNIRVKCDYSEGVLPDVMAQVQQVFQMVSCADVLGEDDARFHYFKEQVLGPILRLQQKRTLIVTPQYLHYIKLRNYFIEQNVNAAYVCEYSRDSEISRGRSRFFHAEHDILLYSGRAHFFRRYKIRGAMHIIFYSLPEYAHFYPELVNLLTEASSAGLAEELSCIVLYTRYEKMALERIVGTGRCDVMLNSAKKTFMFK